MRSLLALLDGDVQQIYDGLDVPFRPRFFPVTHLLMERGSACVSAIAEAVAVSQPAMTQTVAEMKRLGLVALAVGTDRRERTVTLTPVGRALALRLAPVWAAIEGAADALERDLSAPLAPLLDETHRALEKRSFARRIEDRLALTGANDA